MAANIILPKGTGVIDVYLTDVNGERQFKQRNSMGMWVHEKPNHFIEFSKENNSNATVPVKSKLNNLLFICLRNPSSVYGVSVTIEVVALIKETVIDNSMWSEEGRKNIYNSFYHQWKGNDQIPIQDEKFLNDMAETVTSVIIDEKTPEEWENMTPKQRQDFVSIPIWSRVSS